MADQGSYGLGIVMEIDNAIFKDLTSFGKDKGFKMAVKGLWIFVCENSEDLKMDITWYPVTMFAVFIHFTVNIY